MISPVTVVILNQKTGMSKSVHVNNLRYANIGDDWNFERSDDSDSNDEEFKEQNTRKWVRPKRIQLKRRVKRSLRNEVGDNNLSEESNMNNSSDENTEIESEEREKHVVFTPSERRIQPQVTVHHETGINHQDPVEIVGVVAVELVPQRVNRRRSFSTLMLTLGDIVLVRLASNIIRDRCNKNNILIFRKSSLIRYNLFNYYYTQ